MAIQNKTAVTIGKFDGLHTGHMKLMSIMMKEADKYNLKPVVFSFYPTPGEFFTKTAVKNIFSESEKRILLNEIGIKSFVGYPFEKIKDMPPEIFIEKILCGELSCETLVNGSDFRFGKDRSGDIDTLKKYCPLFGINVIEIPNAIENGETVSSSRIKTFLSSGNLPSANKLLGRFYFIFGTVASGKKIGRTIGFPTVNVPIPDDKFLPCDGVYATTTLYDGFEYKSVTNIGINPTINGGNVKKCETFIINFDEAIYGKELKILFNEFIRDEMKFDSIDELKAQIKKDAAYASK